MRKDILTAELKNPTHDPVKILDHLFHIPIIF